MDEEVFRYYVTWVDQGPAGRVYGSFITKRSRLVETESDIHELHRIAGAKNAEDRHIVILDWKRIN